MKKVFTILFTLLYFQLSAQIFVDQEANGLNDGSSWEDAYQSLHHAIDQSVPGDEIWVKTGIYTTTESTDRTIAFVPKAGIKIYGGFLGEELILSERNLDHKTILSGDIGDLSNPSDNSYNVIRAEDINNFTLDGFIITGGYTNSGCGEAYRSGGGIDLYQCRNTFISNCIFDNNKGDYGGGLAISKEYADPMGTVTITNCIFRNNTGLYGGGIQVQGNSTCKVYNSLFYNNETGGGGAIQNNYSTSYLYNCTFYNNYATARGGNSILNYSGEGQFNADIFMYNCILWNDNPYEQCDILFLTSMPGAAPKIEITNCCIKDTCITNCINSDPLFFSIKNSDFSLSEKSPCINSGTLDISGYNIPKTDLGGSVRVYDGRIDMGPYEYLSVPFFEDTISYNDILMFPNPTSGKLKIKSAFSLDNAIVQIFEVSGKFISRMPLIDKNKIDISFIPHGVYIIAIRADNKVYSRKIVKK